jgi:transketolase
MPSWELFEKQTEDYHLQVLPPEVTARVAVEAGSPQGWYRYVGSHGEVVALSRFGASAPYQILYEKFGLTADRVVEKALRVLGKSAK